MLDDFLSDKSQPMEKRERKVLFSKGDRVTITCAHGYDGPGPGSTGVVMRDVYGRYDEVAVDILKAHDKSGNLRTNFWSEGHDCYGRVSPRNGRWYGYWIDGVNLKKESSVSDEDILLLM